MPHAPRYSDPERTRRSSVCQQRRFDSTHRALRYYYYSSIVAPQHALLLLFVSSTAVPQHATTTTTRIAVPWHAPSYYSLEYSRAGARATTILLLPLSSSTAVPQHALLALSAAVPPQPAPNHRGRLVSAWTAGRVDSARPRSRHRVTPRVAHAYALVID